MKPEMKEAVRQLQEKRKQYQDMLSVLEIAAEPIPIEMIDVPLLQEQYRSRIAAINTAITELTQPQVLILSVRHKWDVEYEPICVCTTKERMEEEMERYLKHKEEESFLRDEFTFTHTELPLLDDVSKQGYREGKPL